MCLPLLLVVDEIRLHPKTSTSKESKVARQLTLKRGDVLGDLGGPNTTTTVRISEREARAQSWREIWKHCAAALETQEGARMQAPWSSWQRARRPERASPAHTWVLAPKTVLDF